MKLSEENRIKLIKLYDIVTYLVMVGMLAVIILVTLSRRLTGVRGAFIVNYTFDVFSLIFATALFGSTVIHDREVDRQSLLFRSVIFQLSVTAFAEALSWAVDGRADLAVYNLLINELVYLSNSLTLFLFWKYMRGLLRLPEERYAVISWIIGLLFAADVILILLNPFTELFFSVSGEGVYVRSAFYPVAHVFHMTVLASSLFISLRTDMPRKQKLALSLYTVIPILAVGISMLLYGVSIQCPSGFAAVLICFLNIYLRKSGELAEKKNEMDYAKVIQMSMLPGRLDISEYGAEAYGFMRTAREVGGDFYDYYMLDESHLVLVMADVSGKGLPAALFMVQGITTLKNYITSGFSLEEAVCRANDSLCYNNDAGLFITCWAGILDLAAGNLRIVNAGHNFPVLRKADGETSFVTIRSGIPLASFDGIKYRPKELVLEKGDTLFLYTDGVTEAHSTRNELFGDDRLLDTVRERFTGAESLNETVIGEVDRFAIGREQFDDITMITVGFH